MGRSGRRRGLIELPAPLTDLANRFDDVVEDRWEALRGNPILDRLFYAASSAGEFSAIWHAAGMARAVARRDPRAAVQFSVVMAVESVVVNGVVKSLFGRARPDAPTQPRPHRLRQPLSTSFPSGHASAAFCAASVLTDRPSRLNPLWWGAAAVVAASRVHVRIHHPSDVVAGAAVGLVLGRVARAVLRSLGR